MIIGLDIETRHGLKAQKDDFLLGCIVTENKKSYTFHQPQEMWDWIIAYGKKLNAQNKKLYVYSANHSFDWTMYAPRHHHLLKCISRQTFLWHYIEDDQDFLIRRETMIRQKRSVPKVKRNYITFLDLLSIYNTSIRTDKVAGLARIGEFIGVPKQETPLYLIENQPFVFSQQQLKEIETYCIRDTEIIIDAIQTVKDKLKSEGIRLHTLYSIHQIAMNRLLQKLRQQSCVLITQDQETKQFRFPKVKYPCIQLKHGSFHSRFCRGGIVQAYQQGTHQGCYKLDCNGFWQHALSEMPIPDIRTEFRIDKPLQKFNINQILKKEGYSHVLIESPKINFGLLPVRVKIKGNITNSYPTNNSYIVGHYTHIELRKALELGYIIHEMEYSVLFETMDHNPFVGVVKETYNIRKASKTEFDNWFYKQMGNSFVGKFTQCFPEYDIQNVLIKDVQQWLTAGYTVESSFSSSSSMTDYYTVTKPKGIRQRNYYSPILYAYTTAYARVLHHETISKFTPNQVLYVDTDSLILKDTTLQEIHQKVVISDKIGDWKFEHQHFNEDRTPKVETCTIWKEKFYDFAKQKHMSGVSLRDIQKYTPGDQTIKRHRLITSRMTEDESLIGTFKEEEINLSYSPKPIQKVYIDEYTEDTVLLHKKLVTLMQTI